MPLTLYKTFAGQTFAPLRLFTCLVYVSTYYVPIAHLRQNRPFPLLYLGHAQIINANCLLENFSNDFKKSPRLLQHLPLNYASCNVKVDSPTFINFQENYQTAEIYFYSYHVIPLNKTPSNHCFNKLLPLLFPNATVST